MASLPKTMRAILQPDYTKPTVTFTPSTPVPIPTDKDDHLIAISFVSPTLNELVWPTYQPDAFATKPHPIPCYDLTGTVISSPISSPFQPGATVFSRIDPMRTGAAAEYVVAKTSELALVPEGIDLAAATGVPMSAETAWQFLFSSKTARHARGILDANAIVAAEGSEEKKTAVRHNGSKTVLVTGAAGGVGLWMVQLARAAGVRDVIAVVRGEEKGKLVAEYGTTEVVDTDVTRLAEWAVEPGRADLVVDCVGMEMLAMCWGMTSVGGVLLSIVMPPEMVKPEREWTDRVERSEFFVVQPDGEQLGHVARLMEGGMCKAQPVDGVFGMGEAEKAFERVEKGRPTGKVVIKVARDV